MRKPFLIHHIQLKRLIKREDAISGILETINNRFVTLVKVYKLLLYDLKNISKNRTGTTIFPLYLEQYMNAKKALEEHGKYYNTTK